jgi:hypothetical protein
MFKKTILERIMAGYGVISADELKDRLEEVELFDVRSPAETDRGVIEGAKLVPLPWCRCRSIGFAATATW